MEPEARRQLMARFRSKDTKPEILVRSLLHRLGYRFRIHVGKLPGKPDIVLPRYRTVILVHGCFWHRHFGCSIATTPKTRKDFWQAKFEANQERDQRIAEQLVERGWRVVVVWECETKDLEAVADRVQGELATIPPQKKAR